MAPWWTNYERVATTGTGRTAPGTEHYNMTRITTNTTTTTTRRRPATTCSSSSSSSSPSLVPLVAASSTMNHDDDENHASAVRAAAPAPAAEVVVTVVAAPPISSKTKKTTKIFQHLLLPTIILFCVIQVVFVEFGTTTEVTTTARIRGRTGRTKARTAAATALEPDAARRGEMLDADISTGGSRNSNDASRKTNRNKEENRHHHQQQQQQVVQTQRRNSRRRRLVILGGPHKSASSSTQEFFFRYATGGQLVDSRRRSSTPSSSTARTYSNATNTTGEGRDSRNDSISSNNNTTDQTNQDIQLRTVLKDWIWPYHPKVQRYTSRKAFAILVKEMPQVSLSSLSPQIIKEQQKKSRMTESLYKSIKSSIFTQHPTANVILGSEEFDRFGTTPYTHRRGLKAISNLIQRISSTQSSEEETKVTVTTVNDTTTAANADEMNVATTPSSWLLSSSTTWDVDIVIAYRRPRSDHWYSIWREIAPRSSKTLQPYNQWICSSSSSSATTTNSSSSSSSSSSMLYKVDPYHDLELWEYLDSVANPLGYILAILEHDTSFRVHMMDMAGMEDRHVDINHGIVCRILLDGGDDNDENGSDGDGRDLDLSDNFNKSSRDLNDNQQSTLATPLFCEGANAGADHASSIDGPVVFDNSSRNSTTVIVRANQKSGDPGLTDEQNDELEFLLRMRDCQYRQQLEPFIESGRLVVHFGDSIWDGCHYTYDTRNDVENSKQPPWNVSSTDDLLYLMQDQAGCYNDTSSTTSRKQLTMKAVRKYRHSFPLPHSFLSKSESK